MTKQKGICEECKEEYEYEYNPRYPRKYCPKCSAAKKAEYESNITVVKMGNGVNVTPVVKPGEIEKPRFDAFSDGKPKSGTQQNCDVICAKDIFCALVNAQLSKDCDVDYKETNLVAINLVKQTREAFE